jgi:Domain of unknown function (DUF4861)
VSTFSFEGDSFLALAAGVAIHEGGESTLHAGKSLVSVWDTPQNPSVGIIATGLASLPAEHARTMTAANHALMLFQRHSGELFTYFAGSGWSKADMPTQADWSAYLERFPELVEHPIAFVWIKQ